MKKQSIEMCLAEYSDKELIQFHANLNTIFLCCNEDFKLLMLLMNVQFALASRKSDVCKKYLCAIDEMMAS